jgi:hypothetical protein
MLHGGDFRVPVPSFLVPSVQRLTASREDIMTTSVPGTDVLDLEISLAYVALVGARGVFDRCPSAENEQRVTETAAEVDRLLDRRLTASRS